MLRWGVTVGTERLLLILDLDETLIHATEERLEREADFRVFDYHVYRRPHLEAFLRGCAEDFRLAVWSSASDDYVAEVVRRIFPPELKLEFAWGRSRCTLALLDASSHFSYAKKLHKLKRRGYRLERVLIVDDTPRKCIHNYGNAIYVSGYEGQVDDDELLHLGRYLSTLKDADNVRTLEKRGWRTRQPG